MLALVVRFPLGMYYAQAQADLAQAEWPPHPVRLLGALVAATEAGPISDRAAARHVLDRLASAPAPTIVTGRRDSEVAEVRGVSRWAPRNHELGELKAGVHPRDLGRGRAEVHKVGMAVGDRPVTFAWTELELDDDETLTLEHLVQDVTVLGASRSPIVVEIVADPTQVDDGPAWRPAHERRGVPVGVRVPEGATRRGFDAWHARRAGPVGRDGAPSKAPLVVVPRLGRVELYLHDLDPVEPEPFESQHWGELLVLAVVSELKPKGPATFALTRATRKALLARFGLPGTPEEAPSILRGRGAEPHAAFVPLSFVGHERSDGHVLGVGLLLPHATRVPDLLEQRAAVVVAVADLFDTGGVVRVPMVGTVHLARRHAQPRASVDFARYRSASTHWSTVTPVIHSRHRPRHTAEALLEQVSAECRDVGLPEPAGVEVRREPRFRGSAATVMTRGLPPGWDGPLAGPRAHLDLWFHEEVVGPVLLGRARHFGLGLCLPYSFEGSS